MGGQQRFKRPTRLVIPEGSRLVRLPELAALDHGECLTLVGYFRALYGTDYPRKFRGGHLDLSPGGPVFRPGLLLRPWMRTVAVREELISARVRPFESQREARRFLGTGVYAPGGPLEFVGSVVVSCQTFGGVLEFGVQREDVPLLLHYVELMDRRAHRP